MRKTLFVAVALICGLYVLVDYFVSDPQIDAVGAVLVEGVMILAAFALLLGVFNLLGTHVRRLAAGERYKGFSFILVLALLVTLILGVLSPSSEALNWVFDYVYYPIQATMAGLLAFFLFNAIYRGFKIRNIHTVLFLSSSLFIFFIQLPFSTNVFPYLSTVRDWIMAIPVTAGMRGIILGVTLGTITTSLRILLAVDHPYTGE